MIKTVGPTIVEALTALDEVAAWAAAEPPAAHVTQLATSLDLAALSHTGRVDLLVALDKQIAWLQAGQQRLFG